MTEYVRAYEGKDPYLFVSYAHKDSGIVLPVVRALHSKKYRVWYDEGIAPGSEWPHNIATHLQRAACVLVFVSQNSLSSPNCKNEVMVAAEQEKKMIYICLDDAAGRSVPSGYPSLAYDESTVDRLMGGGFIGNEFIGDGIAGYEYSINKKRSFNKWNLMLGVAGALAVVFAVSLYGLYCGWFDSVLPAKQVAVLSTAPTAAPTQQAISLSNNVMGSVLPVQFSSDEEKNAVYQKLGWTQGSEMTYKDLMGMNGITHLEIANEPIKDIGFAAFLPDLETINLSSAQITDLTPLVDSPKLKTVEVSPDMLPLKLPENRSFEVDVI